jgi:hypothetical protein
MITLYKYIFCKAYYFCIIVFKERDFPWFFASGAMSMAFVVNILVLVGLITITILPNLADILGRYYGWFSLLMLVSTAFYMKQGNRYRTILEDGKILPVTKRKTLRYISLIYIITLGISLIWVSTEIRGYHAGQQ